MKKYILDALEELHIKLFYENKYENSMVGTFEKLKDQVKYEVLQEVVRNNSEWDIHEMGRELSERIKKRRSF